MNPFRNGLLAVLMVVGLTGSPSQAGQAKPACESDYGIIDRYTGARQDYDIVFPQTVKVGPVTYKQGEIMRVMPKEKMDGLTGYLTAFVRDLTPSTTSTYTFQIASRNPAMKSPFHELGDGCFLACVRIIPFKITDWYVRPITDGWYYATWNNAGAGRLSPGMYTPTIYKNGKECKPSPGSLGVSPRTLWIQ